MAKSARTRKPRGFWTRPETIDVLQRVITNDMTRGQAMRELDCDEEDIDWYTRALSRGRLGPKEFQRTEVISIQIDSAIRDHLRRLSRIAGRSMREMAAMLLNEKLREEEFPFIEFRATPIGRQPFVKGTSLAVWEAVLVGRQFDMDSKKTAAYLQWVEPKVQSAFAYAEAYQDEIEPLVSEAERMTPDDLKRKLPWLQEVRV